jgi:hypothetical protein
MVSQHRPYHSIYEMLSYIKCWGSYIVDVIALRRNEMVGLGGLSLGHPQSHHFISPTSYIYNVRLRRCCNINDVTADEMSAYI